MAKKSPGLHKPTKKNRYSGIKGQYWDLLSDFIRLRDFIEYGTCITCGKKFQTWSESQAGHYISAGNCGFDLLFDKKNLNAECQYDNGFNGNHQLTMRENIVKRYGEAHAKDLDDRYKKNHFGGVTHKAWNDREYKIYLALLQEEVDNLVEKLKNMVNL